MVDSLGISCREFADDCRYSRDGDLRSMPTDSASILRRIALPTSLKAGVPFVLQSRLSLGVGGDGIIGRRVSLLAGHVVLGDGIAGFN